MELMGTLALGWTWLRMARVAEANRETQKDDRAFLAGKLSTARYFAARTLPETVSLRLKVEAGAETLMALSPEDFASV
jgi:hypothetical protein